MQALAQGSKAVVVGGGLLGLEAAYGLLAQGMQVTVIHRHGWLLERQMDPVGADLLLKSLSERGLHFCLSSETQALIGTDHVRALQLTDGRTLETDLVVFAVGIRPRIALAHAAGIHCDRGIVVDDTLQTFDPRIYAVGECVQHRGHTYGLVAPLFEQAKVAANHLAHYGRLRYTGSTTNTKLKVTGISLFSAGHFTGGPSHEEISLLDSASGIYKKVVIENHKLIGILLYGDTSLGPWLLQLLREEADITDLRDSLLFGVPQGDARHGADLSPDTMPDTAEVCGCNGITKGTIVQAIRVQGLFTVSDVRRATKASASCGSCSDLVEQLLAATLGGLYESSTQKRALCGCTDLSHDEVRNDIVTRKLLSVPAVLRVHATDLGKVMDLPWRFLGDRRDAAAVHAASCRPIASTSSTGVRIAPSTSVRAQC
jgi:nitrite reductase (NADH) large subunit